MKNSSFKSLLHPLLACVSSLQVGNPVLSWDLEQEGKQTEIVTLGMRPGVESVPFLSDKPHSHSSKAKRCFPSSSVPFCCLPLIMSQTGKAGAPCWRWDTWHFLLESARNISLHTKIVDNSGVQVPLGAPGVRSWAMLHCPTSTLPCLATSQPPALTASWSMASVSISEK